MRIQNAILVVPAIVLAIALWSTAFGGDLSGQWFLVDTNSTGSAVMTIQQNGNVIRASGRDWEGHGQFDGRQGYYQWRFTNGASGVTNFNYDAVSGTINGSVQGSGLNWRFRGTRRRPFITENIEPLPGTAAQPQSPAGQIGPGQPPPSVPIPRGRGPSQVAPPPYLLGQDPCAFGNC